MTATINPLLKDRPVSWEVYQPRYQELLDRELTPETIEAFLLDWSELDRELDQVVHVRSLNADLNTADEEVQNAYLEYLNGIQPHRDVAVSDLRKKLLTVAPAHLPADARLLAKRFEADDRAFHVDSVPLRTQLAELKQQYSQITGGMLIDFRGEQITVPRVEQLLLSPDRQEREEAWKAWQKARLEIAPKLDEVFLKQLKLRQQIHRNSGHANYRDYMWDRYHRFDYTPQDCLDFHETIETEVVPFTLELLEQHRQGLGIEELKPWDFYWRSQMDPQNRPALQPFSTVEELENKTEQVFFSLSPKLGEMFKTLKDRRAMDLGSRENKMSHAYCTTIDTEKLPFVLQNVVGTEGDVSTTLHEFGHAFHAYVSMRTQRLIWNAFSATEFVEVPSMGMELIALDHLTPFYTPQEIQRAKESAIRQSVHNLPWMCYMDAFQHWLYSEAPEDITIEMLDQKSRELLDRFQPQPNWSGFEAEKGKVWQYYHMFNHPFYYIEYALSGLGAVQLWKNHQENPEKTLQQYLEALEPGDSLSVPELYEKCGLNFKFDRQTVHDLMGFLREQLQG
ncbi:M3 family oligoendopeptidase [Deinococcus roseus]|uniref:Oligoendopeptidase F n=1 Tax=Deinococcus roseus TaxID=392414 RepID=A0ABQ2DJB1_9DEIO|nr:M3 family oligoendopeptidase [Deinococcus roseus]GGJ57225.1 oligoendopeptidase F [Deinococcus roseus]